MRHPHPSIHLALSLLLALSTVPLAAQESREEQETRREVREEREIRVDRDARVRRVVRPRGDVRIVIDDDDPRPRIGFIGDGDGPLHILGSRLYIGLDLTRLTPELRRHFGVDPDTGVMVSKLSESAPAETAGVRVGDIVLAIDGEPVRSSIDLVRGIQEHEAGESVRLALWRDGERVEIDVPVAERESSWAWRFRGDGRDRPLVVLPEIELGDFEVDLDDFDGDWQGALDLDALRDVIVRLGDYFGSEDWERRLERMEKLDLDDVERKMRQVEERLRKLEREIDEASEDPI